MERATVVELPQGTYVEGTHYGPRERIDESFMRLDFYLRNARLAGRGSVHESLLMATDTEDESASWHTNLAQPVEPRED
jgi:hypothetical protein